MQIKFTSVKRKYIDVFYFYFGDAYIITNFQPVRVFYYLLLKCKFDIFNRASIWHFYDCNIISQVPLNASRFAKYNFPLWCYYEISQMFGKANYVWLKRYFIHHISFAQWELRKFWPPSFAFLSVSRKSLLSSTSVWTFSIVASSVSITVWHRWRTFVNASVENVQNHAMCMNTLAYDLGTLSV